MMVAWVQQEQKQGPPKVFVTGAKHFFFVFQLWTACFVHIETEARQAKRNIIIIVLLLLLLDYY